MRVTIEMSEGDLKRFIRETYGELFLSFEIGQGEKAQKIKDLRLWGLEDNWPKRKKILKQIEESKIKDFEMAVPSIYSEKFNIVEIKSSQKNRRYDNNDGCN